MAFCSGTGVGHCCHLAGVVCSHLRDDGPDADRRWVCTLREQLGSWNAVHHDPRYLEDVRPFWDKFASELDCGEWPPKGETCAECEVVG